MTSSEKSPSTTPSKRQAWFCTTGLPSDVLVEVDHMTFHLHKFPLMSKSKKLQDLITLQEAEQRHTRTKPEQTSDLESDIEEIEEHEEHDYCHILLKNFPGGSETFETAAKFCYGVKIELTAKKAAPLRCAGEALQMTEEYCENNLISKTERFLTQNVFTNIKDSIKALRSCENLVPLSENLGIVERCIQTISTKASLYDPTLFGWPVTEPDRTGASTARVRQPWVEDLAKLNSSLFNRVISSMRENDINQEILESCLIHYARRCFPSITRENRKSPISSSSSSSMIATEAEQRELLENIISNLSLENANVHARSRSPAMTRFLFGLLRTANILGVSEKCKRSLERKIGAQLERATLDDLLIPSYSYLNETLYDVDCVERILDYFLECYDDGEVDGENSRSTTIMLVGKLIDGYLSEIASDSNLIVDKFCGLALSLPEEARVYDDGVYRAVDVYLKAHSRISEEDREKICGVMNFEKLTLEACTHAAQNERLPLRAIVQVLFFEQLQLRDAIAGTLSTGDPHIPYYDNDESPHSHRRMATPKNVNSVTWAAAIRENEVLRNDMDRMRTRVHELERECSTMKKAIDKIESVGTPINNNASKKGWKNGTFSKKFGCKFKTQVCDSHESTVVEVRKVKHHSNNNRH
ncbi:BTB/POZ domain-containing protein At5g66560 [Silene latifolia]|uniref:BTB/POZ domain-containing protein At5g66560 n=1 Tax=Silene latifolia TaxID=37657 RepID=UPI003D771226